MAAGISRSEFTRSSTRNSTGYRAISIPANGSPLPNWNWATTFAETFYRFCHSYSRIPKSVTVKPRLLYTPLPRPWPILSRVASTRRETSLSVRLVRSTVGPGDQSPAHVGSIIPNRCVFRISLVQDASLVQADVSPDTDDELAQPVFSFPSRFVRALIPLAGREAPTTVSLKDTVFASKVSSFVCVSVPHAAIVPSHPVGGNEVDPRVASWGRQTSSRLTDERLPTFH